MKLLLATQHRQLAANGRTNAKLRDEGLDELDFRPVVKLFTPDGAATWLLTEIHPELPDIAFGLCDLGIGFPELGDVSLTELSEVRGKLGLPIERDLHFRADYPLSVYADKARLAGRIIA